MTASAENLDVALAADDMTSEALILRLSMFAGLGYYVPPMIDEQRQTRLVYFERAIEGIPSPFTSGAFDEWFNRMSRAPSPGDIGNAARSLVKLACERLDRLRPVLRGLSPLPREFTAEELARRRAFADALMIEHGFQMKGSD